MTIEPAAGYAGNISPVAAWEFLQAHDQAVLIDVRTDAEWSFVGVPYFGADSDRSVHLISWVNFPDGAVNQRFVTQVQEAVADVHTPVLCLCRSGARSIAAATTLTQAGFTHALNVTEGFEGQLDAAGHRGVGGWKTHDLPWRQS